MSLRRYILAVVLGVIVAGAALFITSFQPGVSCSQPLGGSKVLKSQLTPISFGAVTKFKLPSPDRNPNGIVVAPDGSVWFGEQTLPGVGHITTNNNGTATLVEYAWPFSYHTQTVSGEGCAPKTETWAVALWNGSVWASDPSRNQLVGLDPVTNGFHTISLPRNNSFPYSLAVDADNSLWFTELFTSNIGKVNQNGTLHEYSLPGGNQSVPSEIAFANKTLGYYSDAGEAGTNNGAVYAFSPTKFTPVKVTSGKQLNLPTSLSLGNGGLWLALHGSSEVAFYNFTDKAWTSYPTSTVAYVDTTLPYFVKSNGSATWVNEHYGNRLAIINPEKHQLTEYSLANPPAVNGSQIDNALTFALGKDRAWFTEWTANYVGFVDMGYRPTFSVSTDTNKLSLMPGDSKNVTAKLSGQDAHPLTVKFSDSETFTGTLRNLVVSADREGYPSLNGEVKFVVRVQAGPHLLVGTYTIAITVSDGLISRSAYVEITNPGTSSY